MLRILARRKASLRSFAGVRHRVPYHGHNERRATHERVEQLRPAVSHSREKMSYLANSLLCMACRGGNSHGHPNSA
eukprot:scaffold117503_cov69-Phaeocystis_antarctica.AAC.2